MKPKNIPITSTTFKALLRLTNFRSSSNANLEAYYNPDIDMNITIYTETTSLVNCRVVKRNSDIVKLIRSKYSKLRLT